MNTSVSGNFKPYIEGLIEQKRSLGHSYVTAAWVLKKFDDFCKTYYPNETRLTKEVALHWAQKRPDEATSNLMKRITLIRQPAKYMNRLGIPAYLLPSGIPGKQIRYVPHIFTDEELRAFFVAVDQCPTSLSSPARYLVIPVFFRVLYCCGLRLSEARQLKVEEVDLQTGKLVIRQSKGHKDRNVMMSGEVLDLCRMYHSKVGRLFPSRIAFFPNPKGNPYDHRVIEAWFHHFWDKTRITLTSGNPPRVHDFRHTFAVKRLNLWLQEGKDLNAYMPYLCLYLGHVRLTETDYYLHLVPEFFPLFKEKSLEKGANLIPEVNHEGE